MHGYCVRTWDEGAVHNISAHVHTEGDQCIRTGGQNAGSANKCA